MRLYVLVHHIEEVFVLADGIGNDAGHHGYALQVAASASVDSEGKAEVLIHVP